MEGLRDLEVLLHVVLPLVGGAAEDEVREYSEEELLPLLNFGNNCPMLLPRECPTIVSTCLYNF